MQTVAWISLLVLTLIAAGAWIVITVTIRKPRADSDPANREKQPKGYWMSVGISTGVGIGAALGIALENIGIGIALGTAIGAGIGASLEQKNKDKIRPLTEQEKKMQKWGVALGLVMLLIYAGTLTLLLFLKTR